MFQQSHRRLNLLTGEWILVSPHRTQRPWQGRVEDAPPSGRPAHDPSCYLCPGNTRAGGHQNPDYPGTFAFDNDFSALGAPTAPASATPTDSLLQAEPLGGVCRVLCFSPRHDLSLPDLTVAELEGVIDAWTEESRTLGARPDIAAVQVFENKGELMGCSNPHPHSQVWATSALPNEHVKELACQQAHHQRTGRVLLDDVLAEELREGSRLVLSNDTWVVLVPFWAAWPFETLVLPRDPVARLTDLSPAQRTGLADVLQRLTRRYDHLFGVSFPYSMGFHQAPFDGQDHPEWRLHAHFYPPLLRGATVRKFMVGFEMLGMPGRDITPEDAAARLRELPETRSERTPLAPEHP